MDATPHCLQFADFERLRKGSLEESERPRAEAHLRECVRCQTAYESYLVDEAFLGHAVPPSVAALNVETLSTEGVVARPAREHLPRIEGYRIIRWLGAGGMAVVYEAVQEKLNRHVALKLLPAIAGAAQPKLIERFHREATAAARLHHTNIIPIYDFGQSRDGYYYAMELIQGQTLRALIERLPEASAPDITTAGLAALVSSPDRTPEASPQPGEAGGSSGGVTSSSRGRVYYHQVARWMADAADALHYAHACGVIHRDIKPANLILSTDGRIMVADFGLAKTVGEESVTMSGSLLGTYRYMSPEQVGAKRVRVDARTDVYSLGATLYELLAFKPAYSSTDREELLGQILFKEPVAPRKIVSSVPVELQTICQKAMEKSPDARYASARALAEDLRRFTNDLPIVARPIGPVGRAMKFVRRHKAATITTLAILLAAGATATLVSSERRAKADRIQALIEQGLVAQRNKDWAAAESVYSQALKEDPANVRALANLGIVEKDRFYETGDQALIEQSEVHLKQAMELDPENWRIWDYMAVVKRARKRLDEAVSFHQRVLERQPDHFPGWVNLGTVLAMQGKLVEAEEALRRGVEFAEKHAASGTKSSSNMHWRNLGSAQLQLGKSEAAASLAKALGMTNNDIPTLLLCAKMHLELEGHVDLRKASNLAVTADNLGSSAYVNPRAKRVLALTYLRLEQFPEAVEAAQEALKSGDDPASYAHLISAVAQARLGQRAQAEHSLRAAIEAWPTALEAAGFRVADDRDKAVLWFDSADELLKLRQEAETLLSTP